ncbi:epidermal growth factor receptor substrate 15-like 1 isoform X2 [Prorops nasuta]|uniref:epidermal growth factor receptor substrate 15-like 1 isoform X2 n=1 Tax=Prorops nasuta TaxID=863751 RepID=UPI0034CEB30E
MAALPSPTQVAGSHAAIYEAYYNQVDPKGMGCIGAMEAARFLKKSQLSDVILSKIWDMADPQSRGALDKSGLFVALKLCACAQAGQDVSMANLTLEMPPPIMGELPVIPQKKIVAGSMEVHPAISSGDWSIKPSEQAKYDQLFDSLQPVNGYIPGNRVKGVLMDSKLPLDTLGKIWDLADMDKDGMLNRHEFIVAMHLVYKALEKYAIPSVLPPELMPPGKRKDKPVPVSKPQIAMYTPIPVVEAAPPPIPPLPNAASIKNLTGLETVEPPAQQWIVSAEDQIAADKLFLQADLDMDGFVSGIEIKDVFLQSGLPQSSLAHIWFLCDTCQSGKLNKEQFALAMWLIKQKLRNKDPPPSLTPEMIPPSLRKPAESVVENNNISGYSNPELDMINKDIQELTRERHNMEQDIAQKEADIKIKSGEIKSLQSELDTLAATLKQLENQKGEAQKRLNDLKAQVDKLRQQAEEQETVLRAQEEELNSKRQELEGLKQEEQQLEQQQNKSRDQLNDLTKVLQDTQLRISQAKAKITHLEEQQRQMSDAIALYDSALAAGDATIVPDTSLQYKPEIEELEPEEPKAQSNLNGVREPDDAFANANGPDAFGEQDLFASSKAQEAFSASTPDPFAAAFPAPASNNFTADPFTAFDNNSGTGKQDPFDPFGDGKRGVDNKSSLSASKDPFGDDPFANLHAPTRPESPSPALPPKKAKQPPPRPAPPRPSQGPSGPMRAAPVPPAPTTPDPFANANADPFSSHHQVLDNNNTSFASSTGGFADFANFDSKPELIPSRTAPPRPSSRPQIGNTQPSKLLDFTEDPFKDVRYEDLYNISDPFNTNQNTEKDPFGFSTIPPNTEYNLISKGFDNDFNTLPLSKGKADKSNNSAFDADFGKAFSDDNRNLKSVDTDFGKSFNTSESKATGTEETFSGKSSKDSKLQSLSMNFRSVMSLSDKKNRNDKVWNGNIAMTEEDMMALARKQSLKAEEERRKRKEKEDADLALALKLSAQEKSGKF